MGEMCGDNFGRTTTTVLVELLKMLTSNYVLRSSFLQP